MNNRTIYNLFIVMLFCWMFLSSCQQADGNVTGSEYMPDMAHSTAYEANTYTYYYQNTWGSEEEYWEYAKPRLPVEGTVPRGYAGLQLDLKNRNKIEKSLEGTLTNAGISIPINGSVPYEYEDTEEGRAAASEEIIQAAYPITDAALENGKLQYNTYCGLCHGEKADGMGYLVREDGGKYPAQPANLLLDQYIQASNGQYYHAIVYGKNMMGGYADKLSFKERWDVIHYVRSLQAESLKLEYSAELNNLNDWATPIGEMAVNKDALPQADVDHNDTHDGGHEDHDLNDHGHSDTEGH